MHRLCNYTIFYKLSVFQNTGFAFKQNEMCVTVPLQVKGYFIVWSL